MDITQVLRYLPHRYPFLLIDRVLELEPGERLLGLKNVSFNEPFFQGHFPQQPVMPGVLILEALAQATGILAFKTSGQLPEDDSTYYFVGIDNARFKQPVCPGDRLLLDVRLLKTRRGIWVFSAEARVDDKVVCSAELMSTKREHGQ
ncbi:3-hydroxyacyl-ACP dehydratase FabZ [Plasticicumulans sp.]|uniref:3-hydroxyacyl-ACP dehydratase FabZ n=1 Tax=Plasticicumulans sp. TaxID=2307179 RepID=UPI002C9F1376|nr:3-hydroxyacyl-ACP dehydratase FabZ [Plasticicumulans sp.]MBS0601022.1 3-hydroxyacyl-ACP dehydratase FabZ [Pseudomonadota bacterium]HMV38310.1 3-hydroxyacyl-ACP dehydratase FabZ [Plasticicumulans sp.]HMW28904.1 3-hydroxyacyl-ACP dehydratase FabZ [Plasticicumulans sp.]HMW42029.1 3-hydroxyacyl-ACP dehydratase FabZ [Plasticicumulans sp.]HMX54275.1 3-hydroxyacyl-ACP dehydratase FabZ [Plasticicumulans sp.]